MNKKILVFTGIGVLVLTMIFSCTMIDKCCRGNDKKTTTEACSHCDTATCNKNCTANPYADSTKMNK